MKHRKPPTYGERRIKALMIYKDLPSAARAVTLLHRIACDSNMGVQWDLRPWRVEVLRLPTASDEALLEAFDADLIVLAGIADDSQTWLMEWLQCWSKRRRSGGSAVVVTSAGPDAQQSTSGSQLLAFAAQNGLELFIEANPASAVESLALVRDVTKSQTQAPPISTRTPITRSGSEYSSYRGWGINE